MEWQVAGANNDDDGGRGRGRGRGRPSFVIVQWNQKDLTLLEERAE